MRKLILAALLIFTLIPLGLLAQADSTVSVEQIAEYEKQTRQMIRYLEGTLNFIGDPNELPSDKDIIFSESYLKLFADDEVQIEDDLDENREQPLNKDVQAYLKDIDFFYKKVKFGFEIEKTEQIVTDSNGIVFKITLNRHLEGITVEDDTVNNNQLRFIEINLDPLQKDLKIASIYTTKIQEKEEIRNWWNQMSKEWKNYFGKSVIVYDTLPLKSIIWFSDSSLVTMKWQLRYTSDTIRVEDDPDTDPFFPDDSLIVYYDTVEMIFPDTISVATSTLYKILKTLRKVPVINVSDNLIITNLEPLDELSELKELDISNTLISELGPIRNLKNLQVLNCSGSAVTDLSPLKYLSTLSDLNLSKTGVYDISTLAGLTSLSELDLKYSKVMDLSPLSGMKNMRKLDLSYTDISDVSHLNGLQALSDFNIASTSVRSLSSIDSLTSIQHLNIDSTKISSLESLASYSNLNVLQANYSGIVSLDPLVELPELKIIYCNNTGIDLRKANRFMDQNPNCLVIYNSQELENWWNGLSGTWKSVFKDSYGINNPVTAEKLHEIILKKQLSISYQKQINDLEPLRMMHRLEKLDLQHTSVTDLSPLSGLTNLEELNLNNTDVNSIGDLNSLRNIKSIRLEETEISDLTPLQSSVPEIIYCDNSSVMEEEVLRFNNLHPQTLILYQSQNLKMWWNSLDRSWKDEFMKLQGLPEYPSVEELQSLVNLEELHISENLSIGNLNALHKFVRLKKLSINSTSVTDISPLFDLTTIQVLDISKNPISSIEQIARLVSLRELYVRNTSIEDLEPISLIVNLEKLDIGGTRIKSLKYLPSLTGLKELYINNTRIKNIKPLYNIPNLEFLQCYNTSIKESKIEEFKKSRPSVEVIYY